jgi:large subunit ribosomal protein L40e
VSNQEKLIYGTIAELEIGKTAEFHCIFVQTVNGKVIEIRVSSNLPITILKQLITDREGIPEDRQRIIYNCKQFEDGRSLGFYNIQRGATLFLFLRLHGC